MKLWFSIRVDEKFSRLAEVFLHDHQIKVFLPNCALSSFVSVSFVGRNLAVLGSLFVLRFCVQLRLHTKLWLGLFVGKASVGQALYCPWN